MLSFPAPSSKRFKPDKREEKVEDDIEEVQEVDEGNEHFLSLFTGLEFQQESILAKVLISSAASISS